MYLSGCGATCAYFLKVEQASFGHDGDAEGLAGYLPTGCDVEEPVAGQAVAMYLEGDTLGLHGLDFLGGGPGAEVLREHHLVVLALLGREGKGAAPAVLGADTKDFLAPLILHF